MTSCPCTTRNGTAGVMMKNRAAPKVRNVPERASVSRCADVQAAAARVSAYIRRAGAVRHLNWKCYACHEDGACAGKAHLQPGHIASENTDEEDVISWDVSEYTGFTSLQTGQTREVHVFNHVNPDDPTTQECEYVAMVKDDGSCLWIGYYLIQPGGKKIKVKLPAESPTPHYDPLTGVFSITAYRDPSLAPISATGGATIMPDTASVPDTGVGVIAGSVENASIRNGRLVLKTALFPMRHWCLIWTRKVSSIVARHTLQILVITRWDWSCACSPGLN